MKETRIVWLLAAVAMFGVGLWLVIDDVDVFGILLVAGSVLAAIAGITGRDYQGRKPGPRSERE